MIGGIVLQSVLIEIKKKEIIWCKKILNNLCKINYIQKYTYAVHYKSGA